MLPSVVDPKQPLAVIRPSKMEHLSMAAYTDIAMYIQPRSDRWTVEGGVGSVPSGP